VRGLIHSDGCRFLARQKSDGAVYEYARYAFANRSSDIRGLFTEHLALLQVEWTLMSPERIQIARAASVRTLDRLVGAKA
jgi:hypothetical protein